MAKCLRFSDSEGMPMVGRLVLGPEEMLMAWILVSVDGLDIVIYYCAFTWQNKKKVAHVCEGNLIKSK